MMLTRFAFLLLISFPVTAAEKDFQMPWCDLHRGEAEVRLKDRTRVDCLTQQYAIEFDFANKWAEAIGQSLGYSIETGKRAGIVLIFRKPADVRYWNKLQKVINGYSLPITLWRVNAYADGS